VLRPALLVEGSSAGEAWEEVEEIKLNIVGRYVLRFYKENSISPFYRIYRLRTIG